MRRAESMRQVRVLLSAAKNLLSCSMTARGQAILVLAIAPNAKPGVVEISAKIRYQACDDMGRCKAPRTVDLKIPLTILPKGKAAVPGDLKIDPCVHRVGVGGDPLVSRRELIHPPSVGPAAAKDGEVALIALGVDHADALWLRLHGILLLPVAALLDSVDDPGRLTG